MPIVGQFVYYAKGLVGRVYALRAGIVVVEHAKGYKRVPLKKIIELNGEETWI